MPTYIRRAQTVFINAVLIFPLLAMAQQGSSPQPATADTASRPATESEQQNDGAQAHRQQGRRLGAVAEYLNLTDDQKRDWMRIQKETTQNVRAARKDDSLNEQQMQRKLREIHAEQRRQLLALLTPDQQDALKKWWEEQKQKQKSKELSGDASATGGASGSSNKDDDFFEGMSQDDDPPAGSRAQQKKQGPPNP